MNKLFLDLDFCQINKKNENICGDSFHFLKTENDNRLICVLSDGLGSGVKANILASMTASMAICFGRENSNIVHSAEIIKNALPICRKRKISYATFSIINTDVNGNTSIAEMGNPNFILFRDAEEVSYTYNEIKFKDEEYRNIRIVNIQLKDGDRLFFISDGITQAGMGTDKYPLGWRRESLKEYIQQEILKDREISSHKLARCIVTKALSKEIDFQPRDDMTASVIYYRKPKHVLIFTGPPFKQEKDAETIFYLRDFKGTKVICGGTTANIAARELNKPIKLDLKNIRGNLPPISRIEGIDLITEGIFTLTKTLSYLEQNNDVNNDPAGDIFHIMREHDVIEFLVGTSVNSAHQAPDFPIDIELRRNIIKRISEVLKRKYLKTVSIRFV